MELDQLINYLINKENSDGVVLLGHSTGCQVCTCDFIILPPFPECLLKNPVKIE